MHRHNQNLEKKSALIKKTLQKFMILFKIIEVSPKNGSARTFFSSMHIPVPLSSLIPPHTAKTNFGLRVAF